MFQDIQMLDPQVPERAMPVAPSARIPTLTGARIGFVDNSKLNAEQFIEHVAAKLEADYGVEVFVKIRKHAPKDHLKQDDLDRLSQCNAVIQCFGDCGTSTSITVADGVDLEARGVPTATVISSAFSRAARVQASGRGLPDLPIVEIPHPMHTATADQVAERAANAVKAANCARAGHQRGGQRIRPGLARQRHDRPGDPTRHAQHRRQHSGRDGHGHAWLAGQVHLLHRRE